MQKFAFSICLTKSEIKQYYRGPKKEGAPYSGTEHYGTKPAQHLDILYALRYYGKLK